MSAKLDTSLLQRFALSVIATNLKLSTPITPDTDIQMNQSALAANTGCWNKGRENKRQRASPLAKKEAGLFSANHKAKQWHFLCAVSWSLVLNDSDSTQLWIPTFNNQNQKPNQKYLSLIYWVIFADSPYQVNKKGLGFKADRLWVLGMRLTFSKMLLWQNLYYLDNGQYKLLKSVKMVFCATKTALKTGRGRAVHFFLCAEHKQTTNLSFSFWHFCCQFNSKRVRLYLAKWASCDNHARWSFQIRRSHCLATFSPVSPSWYLTNSRIYRRGRLFPPLCFVLLSSIFVFFQNQRWRTQTLSQLSVRSHEKYSVGDGKYSANREELEIIRYQEGLYQFWGWEVVWVIHLEKELVQRAS